MKQVTMESVKQRIADLESAGKVVGGLSLSSEFELACLRELVAVTEQVRLLTEQRDAVVVESNTNLQSAARELNTSWMMHKTMMGAQAALLCISHGDIKAARDWLEGTTDEAFVEIPDDMTPDGLQAWYDSNMISNDGGNGFLTHEEALEKLRQRAPATAAAISALRAEGVEMFASGIGLVYQQLRQGSPQAKALKDVVLRATWFARQLRESKGAQS